MLGKVWESVLVCAGGRGREMWGVWGNVGKGARRCGKDKGKCGGVGKCAGVWGRVGKHVGV